MSQSVISAPAFGVEVSNEITQNVTVPSGRHCFYSLYVSGKTVDFFMWTDFEIAKGTTVVTIPVKYLPKCIRHTYPNLFTIWAGTSKVMQIKNDGTVVVTDDGDWSGWTIFHTTWVMQ